MTEAQRTTTRPPPGRDAPGPALPLNYADLAVVQQDKQRRQNDFVAAFLSWRQLGLGFGLAAVLGSVAEGNWPGREELTFWMAFGGFLIGLSWPLSRRSD